MIAVVLAAGRGSRMNTLTLQTNKCMLIFNQKPLLYYNLNHISKLSCINKIIIVVGYQSDLIKDYFGYKFLDIPIEYIYQEKLDGVVGALGLVFKQILPEDFLLILGDEILIGEDLRGMINHFEIHDLDGVCGIVYPKDKSNISQNYAIILDADRYINVLIEKPSTIQNDMQGTGYCVFSSKAISYLYETPINKTRNQKELCDWIMVCINERLRFKTYLVGTQELNINSEIDYKRAERLILEGDKQ